MKLGLNFLVISAFLVLSGVQSKIPDYIHVCKKNDPNLEKCIIQSIEELKPRLAKGMPELEIPSMEPLVLPEVVVSKQSGFRILATNLTVKGASNFRVTSVKSDLKNNVFRVGLEIPALEFDCDYEINAKILNLVIKGKGPLNANATGIHGDYVLKGHIQKVKGVNILIFDSLTIKLKMKDYKMKIDNLFNGDKTLGDAVNTVINDNKKEMMNVLIPRAEETCSRLFLEIANKVTKHFPYEELFPLS